MLDLAVVHDGDGFEAPVRMGAHAAAVARIGAELGGRGIVQQQEGTALGNVLV
ncbi:hypothetical protein D3C81_2278530 [compost metagenome]